MRNRLISGPCRIVGTNGDKTDLNRQRFTQMRTRKTLDFQGFYRSISIKNDDPVFLTGGAGSNTVRTIL